MFAEQFTSLTNYKPRVSSFNQYVIDGGKVIITKNGKPESILLNINEYNLLKQVVLAKSASLIDVLQVNETLRAKLENSSQGLDFKNEEEISLWWKKEKQNSR